jgi:transcriptional regulator with XRE-family HTH domain
MVRRRQLGTILRKYRLDAGLSVREVAEYLMCHPAKISRMENAQRNISPRDVRDLCNLYNISDRGSREQLMRLARESRENAWWQQFDLSLADQKFFGLEGAAKRIRDFQVMAVPGRLQTREYATALTETFVPDDPAKVKSIVDLRMMRQEFAGNDADFQSILDESVLRRVVGGPEVMRNQVSRLIDLARSQVSLQVVPFDHGAHQGMISGFTVLQFGAADGELQTSVVPDVVFIEGLLDGLYLDRPQDVNSYLNAFQDLQSKALSVSDTVDFLITMKSDML